MSLLIDTAAVPARERLDFWSESSWDAYHPLQIRSGDKRGFWARMSGWELGPLSVFHIATAGNTMIRTSRAIAAGDPECLHVSVMLGGQMNAAQEGRNAVIRAGDVFSYATSEPAVLQAPEPFEAIVVRVPRSELGGDAQALADLTAVRIPVRDASRRAACAYLGRVAGRLEHGAIAPAAAGEVAGRVLEVTRGLFLGPGQAHDRRDQRSRAEILLAIESFIEANLGDPLLDPDEVARAGFISTRYLHKLFEAEGTSVCRWIRDLRLERCRRDLGDPDLAHETILSISSRWGLPGAQHFCRLFKGAFGCSPREFRREATREQIVATGPTLVQAGR